MRVLVTGATGFVGAEVVRHLARSGHWVRAMARRAAKTGELKLPGEGSVDFMAGNVLHPAEVVEAAEGMEAVVHLVGVIRELGENTFENAHIESTRHVIQACQSAGIKRCVHMSALGTRPSAAARYHQTKWMAEELVRASGLDWTILRPSLIYGPRDEFVNLFASISRWSPVLPVMGSGKARMQPLPVESVAHCFVEALTRPGSYRQTLDLCGPTPLTLIELLDTILRVLGRRRWKLRIPLSIARCQARFLEFVWPRLLGQAAPLNRDQLIMLQEDNTGDPDPAVRLLGMPCESFENGIRRFLSHPQQPGR